jgi:Ser/Thr protein kinase RdoA (MazF antagonist)
MRIYHGDPVKLAAPRPSLTSELLSFIEAQYGLRGNELPRDLGGSFNLNVLIDGYVVRVYGPWVSARRVAAMQQTRETLRMRGIPIPNLRPGLDKATWSEFGDCVVEVEHYVNGGFMDSLARLRVGMQALGRLHTLMADLDVEIPPPIANYLPAKDALDATLDAVSVIRTWDPTPEEVRYAEIAEALARMLPVTDLRTQLVHGDYKDTNVLFQGSRLAGILDFDFMGMRPRIDDLALPLHSIVERGIRIEDVRTLVDAYDAGCAVPLSSLERSALPFAMARMPLAYLQYLLLPGSAEYMLRLRREFNEKRGPACEWWLNAIRDHGFDRLTFA